MSGELALAAEILLTHVASDMSTRDPRLLTRTAKRDWVRGQQTAGYSLHQLSHATGIPVSTLAGWASPPPADLCACGAAKLPASKSCPACHSRRQTHWTRERLLAERDRYARHYGGRMPTSNDWNASRNPVGATGWPSASAVHRRFGRWATFLSAPSEQRDDPASP